MTSIFGVVAGVALLCIGFFVGYNMGTTAIREVSRKYLQPNDHRTFEMLWDKVIQEMLTSKR